jgi:hypothetical protein
MIFTLSLLRVSVSFAASQTKLLTLLQEHFGEVKIVTLLILLAKAMGSKWPDQFLYFIGTPMSQLGGEDPDRVGLL